MSPADRRRILAGCVALLVCAAWVAFAEPIVTLTRPRVYPTRLPEGEGRALVDSRCVICHSTMLILQQAKDSTGWEKTVQLMEKWGAPVDSAEHDTLVRYLVAGFGPRKAR